MYEEKLHTVPEIQEGVWKAGILPVWDAPEKAAQHLLMEEKRVCRHEQLPLKHLSGYREMKPCSSCKKYRPYCASFPDIRKGSGTGI